MRRDDWATDAQCARVDPEIFFPDSGDRPAIAEAKSICASCPVRIACLDEALAQEGGRTASNRFGIRGGKTHSQRYHLYTRMRKQERSAA